MKKDAILTPCPLPLQHPVYASMLAWLLNNLLGTKGKLKNMKFTLFL